MRPLIASVTLGVLLLGAHPAVSTAATASTLVSGEKRWVVFEAGPGESNRLLVEASSTGRLIRLTDAGAEIAAGPGCETDPQGRVLCSISAGVRLVQARLADGADRADARTPSSTAAQVNVKGGPGRDLIRGQGRSRFNFAGDEGDDQLVGGDGRDILRGGAGRDLMTGRGGADLMIGDDGNDVLRAGLGVDRLFGGADADKLDARDQPAAADAVVACGKGRDRLTLDRVDRPRTSGCEALRVSASAARTRRA